MLTTAAVVGDPLPLHSPARELLFRDFCEALVRVGHLKFLQLPTLDRRVQALLQGHILAHAGRVGHVQPACRGWHSNPVCASSQPIMLPAYTRERHMPAHCCVSCSPLSLPAAWEARQVV